MSFTYDPTTPTGQMRLLCCQDTDAATAIFSDEEYTAFLGLEGGSVKRGAAMALETVAGSEAFILKVIRTATLTTDGRGVAAALIDRAKLLRAQDLEDDARAGSTFEIAEFVTSEETYRQALWNAALRGQL